MINIRNNNSRAINTRGTTAKKSSKMGKRRSDVDRISPRLIRS